MASIVFNHFERGKTVYAIITLKSGGKTWCFDSNDFVDTPARPYLDLPENAYVSGLYQSQFGAEGSSVYPIDAIVSFYEQAGGSPDKDTDTRVGSGDLFIEVNYEITLATVGEAVKDAQAQITAVEDLIETVPTAVDAALVASHGEGDWSVPPEQYVIIPPLTGKVYQSFAVEKRVIQIKQNDTPWIPFVIDGDYTGWTIEVAAKEDLYSSTRAWTITGEWTDSATGQGRFHLAPYENEASQEVNPTGTPHTLYCGVRLVNGDVSHTVLEFTLVIDPSPF